MYRTIVIAGLLLAGCGQGESAPPVVTTPNVAPSIDDEVRKLRSEIFHATYDPNASAWLSPSEKGFSFLTTSVGALAISVEDISAHGDGSRLTFRVGNPSSATITSIKLHAEWGPLDPQEDFVVGQTRQGDKTISENLAPGRWNRVVIDFAGIAPGKFGRVVFTKPIINTLSFAS